MTIKQGFKFLDAFSFSLKHKIMLLVGQTEQVLGSVIILDTIKMMDYPSLRQRFAVSFFPDKNMLTNIAISISSLMVRSMNKDISRASYLPTFPIMMFGFPLNQMCYFAIRPSSFLLATLTSLGEPSTNRFATINTEFRNYSSFSFVSAIRATDRTPMNHFPTIEAGVFILFLILYLCLIHITIIPYFYQYINLNQCKLRQEMPNVTG